MYSNQFLDHFQNPRNTGELPAATHVVVVENPVCGDVLKLYVQLEDERPTAVTYQARGCPATIAAGSALTEWLIGHPVSQWNTLDAAQIERQLGGLPQASRHAAQLAVDAVRALLRQQRARPA